MQIQQFLKLIYTMEKASKFRGSNEIFSNKSGHSDGMENAYEVRVKFILTKRTSPVRRANEIGLMPNAQGLQHNPYL